MLPLDAVPIIHSDRAIYLYNFLPMMETLPILYPRAGGTRQIRHLTRRLDERRPAHQRRAKKLKRAGVPVYVIYAAGSPDSAPEVLPENPHAEFGSRRAQACESITFAAAPPGLRVSRNVNDDANAPAVQPTNPRLPAALNPPTHLLTFPDTLPATSKNWTEIAPLFEGAGRILFNGDTVEMRFVEERERGLENAVIVTEGCRKAGAEPVLITGNHDAKLTPIGHVELANGSVLVTHGDILFPGISPWSRESALLLGEQQRLLAARPIADPLENELHAAKHAMTVVEHMGPHFRRGARPDSMASFLHEFWPPCVLFRILTSWPSPPTAPTPSPSVTAPTRSSSSPATPITAASGASRGAPSSTPAATSRSRAPSPSTSTRRSARLPCGMWFPSAASFGWDVWCGCLSWLGRLEKRWND